MNKYNQEVKCDEQDSINYRMEGFDKVLKSSSAIIHNSKFGELPYGFKRYLTCPKCGKIVEIESISEKQAVYICINCNKSIRIQV